MGLHQAGFEVTGVDIEDQPGYPFRLFCGDALQISVEWCRQFDLIWASPPCQAYSQAAQAQRAAGKVYPDLIASVRKMLWTIGVPWIIENVPGAPLRADVKICGCQVGLPLRRVRLFECSFTIQDELPAHYHIGPVVSVVGHGTPTWVKQKLGFNPTIAYYRAAMGIGWMNRDELSQAIPPAYSKWLAEQFLRSAR
jgi:DNA (cytosine-5)-methyltransferase 1